MPEMSILNCSFCGKHMDEVLILIQGPLVQICNECVDLSYDIVSEHIEKVNRKTQTMKRFALVGMQFCCAE